MSALITTGRVATGLFFILAGINKLINYGATSDAMQAVGLTPEALLLPATILLEIGAGLILLIGRGERIIIAAALALTVFTLATNIFFHRFWELKGQLRQLELSLFFKNLVVVAALLMIAGLAHEKTRLNGRVPSVRKGR
ncbi:MAG: DoxX family protein [Pseudomonadota bacterium]